MQQQDSYADFTPLRQSSVLTDKTLPIMQQQDSYANFAPIRQSSLLTDQTLPMNGTDVYANISVVWPALYKARELKSEQSRNQYALQINNVIQSTLPKEPTKSNLNESEFEETIWTTALDISFSPEESIASNKPSVFDVHRPVLNYMIEKTSSKDKINRGPHQPCFNDTLPMDHESLEDTLIMDGPLEDTLIMDGNEHLDDTLPMNDDIVSDTLPMHDSAILYKDLWIKEKIADTQIQTTGNQNFRRIRKAKRSIRPSLNRYY